MPLGRYFQLVGLLMCCLLHGNTALAQTPEPTSIKYPDATASPAVRAAFTQALEKCQAELRADYDRKMAKAVTDGKPHLVPVLERLRDGHLVELCQVRADIAAGEQRIAAGEQKIAAGEQRIAAGEQRIAALKADTAAGEQRIAALKADTAANEALSGLYSDTKRLVDKITSRTETPKDISDLQRTHQALKDTHAARPDADALRLIQLLDGLLAKYKRLQ
jgi:phage shock protein A